MLRYMNCWGNTPLNPDKPATLSPARLNSKLYMTAAACMAPSLIACLLMPTLHEPVPLTTLCHCHSNERGVGRVSLSERGERESECAQHAMQNTETTSKHAGFKRSVPSMRCLEQPLESSHVCSARTAVADKPSCIRESNPPCGGPRWLERSAHPGPAKWHGMDV